VGGKGREVFGTVLALAAIWASQGAAAPYVGSASFAFWSTTAVAYGAWSAREARKKAMDAQAAALQDRKIMLRGGTVAKNYAYGRSITSGVIAFHRSPKSQADRWFWLVLALPIAHEITGIDQIWFGDSEVTPLDTNGYPIAGEFFRQFTKTYTQTGRIPVGKTVTLTGAPENVSDTIRVTSISAVGIQNPPQGNPSGDDTFQDNINPDATASIVTGTNNAVISGGDVGKQYTITYQYQYHRPYMQVWRYLGTTQQLANTELINATVNEGVDFRWRASDRLLNTPYIVIRMWVDPDVFPKDLETITVAIRGKKVLDTRTGVVAYSENSMLCARDYAVNECDVLAGEIDIPKFNAEVNVCDDMILIPHPFQPNQFTNQNRYLTNCLLSTEVEPLNNLGIILSSCDGSAVQSGATVDLRCGHYTVPTIVLDDSDLAGSPLITRGPERPNLFNGMRCRYVNADKPFFPMEDAPPYISQFYISQDGGREKVREVDLPATINVNSAQRLIKQMLLRERAALTVQGVFKTKGFQFSPEQTVFLSLRSLGMDEKPFRIKTFKAISWHQVEMTLQEDGPLLYQFNFDESAGIDPAPNSNLPSVRNVPLIQGLSATTNSSAAAFGPNGELVPQCKVSWLPVTDSLVLAGGHIDVRHKRSYDLNWNNSPQLPPTATEYRFPCQRDDVLVIEARCANSLVNGQWVSTKKIAEDTPVPPMVSANLIVNASLVWTSAFPDPWVYPNWAGYVDTGSGFVADTIVSAQEVPLPAGVQSNIASMSSSDVGVTLMATTGAIVFPANTRFVAYSSLLIPAGHQGFIDVLCCNSSAVVIEVITTYLLPPISGGGVLTINPVSLFGKTPSGTAYLHFRIGVTTTNQSVSILTFHHPYLGLAAEGQVKLPPWRTGD